MNVVSFLLTWALGFVGIQAPETLVLDGKLLSANRLQIQQQRSPEKVKAYEELLRKADDILQKNKTYSVMQKSQVPPSGSKHDYMSMGPYWWPDPTRADGKPYIRKDGERNPEILGITDHEQLGHVEQEAETLALAYYFSENEKYAQQASRVLRAWFLDDATRMNPNLNFGQAIPGRTQGRGIGIIETRELYRVMDAALLLRSSQSWTQQDHQALKKWFSDYLTWLTESPIGLDEADEHNNHGTYYDVQILSMGLFTGREDVARRQIPVVKVRLASQLQLDGSQPHELARTLSWNYSSMNLYGFLTLARLAEHLSVDLWHYQTPEGKGIRKAIDWMLPFLGTDKAWNYKQIKPRSFETFGEILSIATHAYEEPLYAREAATLQQTTKSDFYDQLTLWGR